jgi:phosphoglycerate-specific signal transduction histidine kinase
MELALTLPMILGDRALLQQVIINLVLNGVNAMQSVTDRGRELMIDRFSTRQNRCWCV